jgi:hypothetical protein
MAKEAADKYIAACVAPGTLRGYKKEWVKWLTFARRHEYRLAPPRPADLEALWTLSTPFWLRSTGIAPRLATTPLS